MGLISLESEWLQDTVDDIRRKIQRYQNITPQGRKDLFPKAMKRMGDLCRREDVVDMYIKGKVKVLLQILDQALASLQRSKYPTPVAFKASVSSSYEAAVRELMVFAKDVNDPPPIEGEVCGYLLEIEMDLILPEKYLPHDCAHGRGATRTNT